MGVSERTAQTKQKQYYAENKKSVSDKGLSQPVVIEEGGEEHTHKTYDCHKNLVLNIVCARAALGDCPGVACGEHHNNSHYKENHNNQQKRIVNRAYRKLFGVAL